MVTVFVDTSALIALLDADDARHGEAGATLEWLRSSAELVTTNYVQIEALAVARRRLGRDAAARLLDSFFPLVRLIWVDQEVHAVALASYRSSASAVSVVDRVSFTVMRNQAIETAFAFDEDFDREGFAAPATEPRARKRIHEPFAPYSGEVATDLVSVAELAARAGRPINTIQSWRRRHPDFPAPVAQLAAGPVWIWPSIAEWIAARPVRRVAGQT